ncbi:hypothetical protein BDN71DRAFT_1510289 [Pleurotus eryngii]|uniref:Uncharacterized protein n=1 Tax=Pleurotus eryngii TaxID=5323 RepID=A0A9P5ZTH7_PLEER|nr:hypothetical protein BDN71DRAFT_1510289 [Pleurotus eryngii]
MIPGFMTTNMTPDQLLIVGEVMWDQIGHNLRAKRRKEAAIKARLAEKALKHAKQTTLRSTRQSNHAEFNDTTPSHHISAPTTSSPPIASSSALPPLSPEEELAMFATVAVAPDMLIDLDDHHTQASEPST